VREGRERKKHKERKRLKERKRQKGIHSHSA